MPSTPTVFINSNPLINQNSFSIPHTLIQNSTPSTLYRLALENINSTNDIDRELGSRLNLFTGDNGLGKTFLLDVAWWVLTETWANNPILPRPEIQTTPTIKVQLARVNQPETWITRTYDYATQSWVQSNVNVFDNNIIIYGRSDGGFSLFDSIRLMSDAYHFTADNLWNGLDINNKVVCNGLIRDWVTWQNQPEQDENSPFQLLTSVMEHLSPHQNERMTPGKPTRISIDDIRDIPTLNLPYGNVPITHISAGMKRILSLAYLLVWSWYEHQQAAKLRRQTPTQQLILLIDEIETHLHPQWQRVILPAILSVMAALKQNLAMQIMVTTHSPLVLASVEPHFDEEQDKLFHFNLVDREITLEEVRWVKEGDAVNWLTSDIFGLKQARSVEAERAINAANTFMRGESLAEFPPDLQSREQIHQTLLRVLPGHDDFWPRWVVTANSL